jgi:large conductance mechanosensitive channel
MEARTRECMTLRIFDNDSRAGDRQYSIWQVLPQARCFFHYQQGCAMSMISEFKQFVMQGNVVDLAVGLLIGSSFAGVVNAFSDGFVKPIITSLSPNQVALKVGIFDVGLFLTAVTNFIIVVAVLFFVFVKPMNALKARMKKDEEGAGS